MKKSPQENKKLVKELESILNDHLFGVKLQEDNLYYIVKFINGVKLGELDGLRSTKEGGKICSLVRLIRKLDIIYNSENEWRSSYVPLNSLENIKGV